MEGNPAIFAVLLAASLLLFGCASQPPPEENGGNTVTVTIKDFAFSPGTVTIHKGDTVKWVNKEAAVHTISALGFSSPSLRQDATYEHTFNEAGSFNYVCGIPPFMAGRVIAQ